MTAFSPHSQPSDSDIPPAKASQPSQPPTHDLDAATAALNVNWNSPLILKTKTRDGKLIMPAAWRDAEDPDAEDDY